MGLARTGWAAALLATGFGTALWACGGSDSTGTGGPDTLEIGDIQMSGDQEVPPAETTGRGTASPTLTGNLLRVTGTFEGLSAPLMEVAGSSAHVHDGPIGQSGPIVFNLVVTPGQDGRSGTFEGEQLLDQNQLRAFQAGRYYVNVHTQAYPGGEIRGQLAQPRPASPLELPNGKRPDTNPGSKLENQPRNIPGKNPPTFPGLPAPTK
jgi:hypothetical protein